MFTKNFLYDFYKIPPLIGSLVVTVYMHSFDVNIENSEKKNASFFCYTRLSLFS